MGERTFTEKQLQEFKIAFGMYDEDGDGKIDSDATARAIRACGVPLASSAAEDIVADLDIYSDSECNWDSFLELLKQHWQEMPTKTQLLEAFKKIDADGSGALSRDELKRYLSNIGDKLTEDEVSSFEIEIFSNQTMNTVSCFNDTT
eukprot:m.34771 g.34771  ORF g.34771 m.34771 type:complete len:147 (-) comp9818_c0_seq1:730-1170(-)